MAAESEESSTTTGGHCEGRNLQITMNKTNKSAISTVYVPAFSINMRDIARMTRREGSVILTAGGFRDVDQGRGNGQTGVERLVLKEGSRFTSFIRDLKVRRRVRKIAAVPASVPELTKLRLLPDRFSQARRLCYRAGQRTTGGYFRRYPPKLQTGYFEAGKISL
jgi:hypothetical protein